MAMSMFSMMIVDKQMYPANAMFSKCMSPPAYNTKKTNVKHRLYRAKLASAVNMLWPRDCPSVRRSVFPFSNVGVLRVSTRIC